MSDRIGGSWMYGDGKPVVTKAVPTATVVEVGDLIGTVAAGDNPYPASDETWDTNLATTQANFVTRFLGVAQERSRSGDTDPIKANTAAVHEFDCAAATFELGDLVGPAKQTGNALENQKVVAVSTEAEAIGRVVKYYGSSTTKVLVEVMSSVTKGRVA